MSNFAFLGLTASFFHISQHGIPVILVAFRHTLLFYFFGFATHFIFAQAPSYDITAGDFVIGFGIVGQVAVIAFFDRVSFAIWSLKFFFASLASSIGFEFEHFWSFVNFAFFDLAALCQSLCSWTV